MNNLIVYCEMEEGKPSDISYELLGKGRDLAEKLGCEVEAVVIGSSLSGVENRLFAYGADRVFVFDNPKLHHFSTLPYAEILIQLFKEKEPQIVLFGATPVGRELGPRVSSALHSGLTADCTDLNIGSYEDKKNEKSYEKLLYQIRPAFGGNIIATIVNPECRPQMATVREGVMKKLVPNFDRKGELEIFNTEKYLREELFVVELLEENIQSKSVNIKNAPIIVAGGYGVGSKEGFDLLYQLASLIGGEVGASRAAVDAGWVEGERQIGQTGVCVRPKLYIACGISGQVQHLAGMQESAMIISINTDADAPINQIADYVIEGRVEDVLPKMMKYFQENSK
ncbi:MAG TPA: electron transfer flavoprotein subunit alpha [Porphyromonadaceae bacterium]|nr:electron transfer flavoprotein subunit alpha [Porphyromonadaceae bacterium]